jgi:hypothetical protein
VANVAALGAGAAGLELTRATRAAALRRPCRAALVRLAYPGLDRRRRAWLVMHDRVHAALRGPIGDLARRTGATVLAGTALLDHPRQHWEAWPDRGNLFHTAWCFQPDGEPGEVLRQEHPNWPPLAGTGVDRGHGGGARLATPVGDVAVSWRDLDLPGPALIAWAPRLWRARRDRVPTLAAVTEELLAGGARVAVCSSLGGRLGAELVDQTLIARPGAPVARVLRRGGAALAWQAVALPEAG